MVTHNSPWLGFTKAPSFPTAAPGQVKHCCFVSVAGTFPPRSASIVPWFAERRSPHSWLWFLVWMATSNNFSSPPLNAQTRRSEAVKSCFTAISFSSGTNTALCACPGKLRPRNFLEDVMSQAERRNVTQYFCCNSTFSSECFYLPLLLFAQKLIAEQNITLTLVQHVFVQLGNYFRVALPPSDQWLFFCWAQWEWTLHLFFLLSMPEIAQFSDFFL